MVLQSFLVKSAVVSPTLFLFSLYLLSFCFLYIFCRKETCYIYCNRNNINSSFTFCWRKNSYKILVLFYKYMPIELPKMHVHLHPSCCILANTVFFWMAFTKAFIHRIYIGKTLRQSLSVIFSKISSVC